jgi:nitroimidazol reductase NimA-like FMN-containing flavoprotein (pyridoxamine 5'-phosphate oxidase superfamily)
MGTLMDGTLKSKILELLDQHRLMTLATNRPDGWPQATTVGYVNDRLTIYFLCSPQSQQAANLARDSRISLTIDHDVSDPMAITGLSMAAQAQPVTDPTEVAKAMNLLQTSYPEYAAFPMPKPEEIAVYRVLPQVISVLDYSKGFGHSDLVTV